MIPYILAAVGGYLIGDSLKGKLYAEGGMMAKGGKTKKGDIGKSGTQYGYTLKEYEEMGDKIGLFVSPKQWWKSREGKQYKDSFGRTQTIDEHNEMMSYGYRIAIGMDLGSNKIPESARRYVIENNLTKEEQEYADGGMMAKGGSSKYYIEFLNKKKGFSRDKKEFDSYEDAIKWGRKNLENFNSDMVRMEYADGGMMAKGGEFKPYGKTKGKFKLEYKIDGEPQSEIWETKEMVEDSAKRYSKIGYTDIKITQLNDGGKMADGGMAKGGSVDSEDIKFKMYSWFKAWLGNYISDEELVNAIKRKLGTKWFRFFKGDTLVSDWKSVENSLKDKNNREFLKENMEISLAEKSLEIYNSKGEKLEDGGMMAKGGQVYKLGDKWSSNFDYNGMLETALKAQVSWGVNKLRKLYDSFEDVNYHRANRSLWEAINSLKDNDVKAAEKHLENFRSDVLEELK